MRVLFVIVTVFFISLSAFTQNSDSTRFVPRFRHGVAYTLKMRDGNIYSGYVKNENRDFVVLENKLNGESVELRKSEIIRIDQANNRDLLREQWGENLHAKDYMLLSSAFEYEEGKATTNSHWLLLENIDYAFNSNWAINLNTIAFYPVTLGVKCAYQVGDEAFIGANIFAIGDITSGGNSSLLFGYGAQGRFTKGSSNKNLTLSAGVIGLNSSLFYLSPSKPFVNLPFVSGAYCNRLSKGVALTLEGWYLPEIATGLGGIGVKFVGDETTCWTVGCFAFTNAGDNGLRLDLKTLPIPYFGVARRFN